MDYFSNAYFALKNNVIKAERRVLKVDLPYMLYAMCIVLFRCLIACFLSAVALPPVHLGSSCWNDVSICFLQELGFCVHVKHPHKVRQPLSF